MTPARASSRASSRPRNGNRSKDGDGVTCVETRLQDDDRRRRRARRARRRRQHRRARSESDRRRLERPAERRRRRPARCVLHARAEEARRRRRRHRRRARAGARWRSWSPTKPITICWSAKARRTSRASMGIKIEEGLINETARKQWLEWKRRTDPLHYLDPKKRCAGVVRRGPADGARRTDRRRTLLGHDQLRRRQRQRRSLRRDDDQRAGVEDPGPRRRFADSRRWPLRRRRRRRRRFDRSRRGESLQPLARSSSSRRCAAARIRRTPR